MIAGHDLKAEAIKRGYRPEILEKVYRLLDLLTQFMHIPFLQDRIALKGGTAINLLCSEHLPRLSVDLDFNYIGSVDREVMSEEKKQIEMIILDVCARLKYSLQRNPRAHAGGKMVLIYQSAFGNKGRIEIDMNYMFRIPLWGVSFRAPPPWLNPNKIAVLDIHELAAGKLHALLGREASRDLFDSHQLLTKWLLDPKKIRLAFTIYAAMERDHWQRISTDNIKYSVKDIRDKLIPVLKRGEIPDMSTCAIESWVKQMLDETKTKLSLVLPFQENEIEFLERLQKFGEIRPELISDDDEFCQRIMLHPSLKWRAMKKDILKI